MLFLLFYSFGGLRLRLALQISEKTIKSKKSIYFCMFFDSKTLKKQEKQLLLYVF